MHDNLKRYIKKRMDEAAGFVVKYMPVGMDTDTIYESIIGEPHVAKAFSEAVQYLPPSITHRRAALFVGDQLMTVMLKFAPTDKYPVFLLPKYDLHVTQESELAQSLAMAIEVARDWDLLTKTWEAFVNLGLDAHTMAFLFPWVREITLNPDMMELFYGLRQKAEREKIEREVRATQRRFAPKNFPKVSVELNRVCQSGKRLFGQYRMLEAAMKAEDLTQAPLSIDKLNLGHLSPWVFEHINEAVEDWREDEHKREEQEKQAALARWDDGDDSIKLRRVRR